jgi:hypothetical protein
MAHEKEKEKEQKENEDLDQKEPAIQSDPETLNTTDPQEHMKGPVSSLVQKVGESFDDKDADKKPKGN